MKKLLARSLALFGLLMSGLVLGDCDTQGDIGKALGCLSGITYREVLAAEDPKIPVGYRRFEIRITQPVDHFNAALGTFTQRLALLHKDTAEPIVLQTSGYQIFGVALSELARVFAVNQLQVEHRYFDQSIPAIQDWSKLNIVQSAYDFHRIATEFKKIFRNRWVNTGASKGGMTSIYHHRFFPGDLSGTVADVAPLSFSSNDLRYIKFVDEAGGDLYRDCRAKLTALQFGLLKRRDEIMALSTGSFVFLGGKSVSYEHAVIELPFAFWQYQSPEDPDVGCKKIPSPDASAAELAWYLDAVNSLNSYADTSVFSFMPYYFQAATQLGSPAAGRRHLAAYLKHPYNIDQYTPNTAHYAYSNAWMRDVANWVKSKAEHILFVYGEFDPWSAGAYPKVSQGSDFHWFQVPGGNHASKLFKLPEPEKAKALAVVSAWLGKRNVLTEVPAGEETLDRIELARRRSAKLP
jgi:hypothetical protein